MSQKAFLRAFDQAAGAAFADAGMADPARYTAPGAGADAAQDCTVLVDRGTQQWGTDPMPVAAGDVSVSFLAPAFIPVKGGVVMVDGDTYRLTDKLDADGSLVRFAVVPHV